MIIIGSFSYSAYSYMRGPCADPIVYQIGVFNDQFGVSKEAFVSALAEAEALWETAVGKDLFTYSTVKGMPVHLLYDERQATVLKNKKLEATIDQVAGSADEVKQKLEALKIEYTRAKLSYDTAVTEFKTRQDAHVAQVDYWNTKGGAPADEYKALSKESGLLQILYKNLETKRIEVNDMAVQLNNLVSSYNGLVKNINSNVAVINESADKEFEQGEYVSDATGERINIYEFTDRQTLVRVLAHELGHALGIDHNSNKASIMYYLNGSKNMVPTAEDVADLKKVCRFRD